MSSADVADTCADCGGSCCSFRAIRISFMSLDEGQRYDSLMLEDESVSQLVRPDGSAPDMRWYVLRYPDGHRSLVFECQHLEDGICTVYENRPDMCRTFECPALEGEQDLTEFKRQHAWRADPEAVIEKEVTERVTEIIEREGEPWDPEAEDDE